jgi:hypothetical protein
MFAQVVLSLAESMIKVVLLRSSLYRLKRMVGTCFTSATNPENLQQTMLTACHRRHRQICMIAPEYLNLNVQLKITHSAASSKYSFFSAGWLAKKTAI